jgi:putative ABC transport system ATP-binding protein
MKNSVIVSASNVERVFGSGDQKTFALRGINLDVRQGEFVAIMGRSGSGKTTLLNILGGLDSPTTGRVLFDGLDLSQAREKELTYLRRHRVGYIFQMYGLLPILSAYENVELSLRINGTPRRDRRERALQALEMTGLASRIHHRPYELSGGEQRRVAIARSLAVRPPVLLADEPTGDLDSGTGAGIIDVLKGIVSNQGITIIATTHEPALAAAADRILHMADGNLIDTPS